ncbi:hypothetical protein SAMN04488057_104197 [Cyclobacterium lianum]|uniref:PH domain-containing protein n=1 Tax=Cyclobacterium lianum TaxID=388280 RepID=A0A1M7MC80_9BACT|nr:hypothetical protein [Cyclobacterium lianum]SHM87938.1 hypothetical protein SAMN04488057_104197 [Cyclobacterium lianum]
MMNENKATKNYFLKDLLNPAWIIAGVVGAFAHYLALFAVMVPALIYVMWQIPVIEIVDSNLVIKYPNWIFYKKEKRYEFEQIEKVDIRKSNTGYASMPFIDIYTKKGRSRSVLSPSMESEDFNGLLTNLKNRLGEKVSMI